MRAFKSTSLADQVFDKLENDIIQGVYPKGEVLTELKNREEANAFREAEERKAALQLKEKMDKIELVFLTTGGADGRLYGAITTKDISEKLETEHKISIDKKKIDVGNIKIAGEYSVAIKIYRDISATVKVLVKA